MDPFGANITDHRLRQAYSSHMHCCGACDLALKIEGGVADFHKISFPGREKLAKC